jgi:hypothetical protein
MNNKATHSPNVTYGSQQPIQPQAVAQNPCGIDTPHKLHTATLEQATYHLELVLGKHPWLRSKAAGILEDMQLQACMPYLPSLAAPREHSAKWYSVQLMRAYMHTHSTHSVRQRIEQLYEVML